MVRRRLPQLPEMGICCTRPMIEVASDEAEQQEWVMPAAPHHTERIAPRPMGWVPHGHHIELGRVEVRHGEDGRHGVGALIVY